MQSRPVESADGSQDLEVEQLQQLYREVEDLGRISRELRYYTEQRIPDFFRKASAAIRPSPWLTPNANLAERDWQADFRRAQTMLARREEELELLRAYLAPGKRTVHSQKVMPPMQANGDKGWVIPLPGLAQFADDLQAATRSRLLLFENEALLGPAHTLHDEVRSLGGGRYSHWMGELIFSTSDGSDPNTNRRNYTIIWP
jgi:hypothetical protein